MWTNWNSVQSWDELEKKQQPADQLKCNATLEDNTVAPTASPTTTTMGHSVICLNLAQRPASVVCTSRSSSKLSFLITALLAFSFGIGIGVFIPLYFLPVSNSAATTSTEFIQVQPLEFTLTPQSVIDSSSASPAIFSADDDRRTFYLSDYSSTPSSASYNVVPSRLNSNHRRTTTKTTVRGNLLKNRELKSLTLQQPSYRRPTLSSVKFIVPDVRVLSLDPIQHDDSPVRIDYESGSSSSRNKDSDDSKVSSSFLTNNVNSNNNNNGEDELLDGIYWSDKVEQSLPQGFTDQDIQSWRTFVKRSAVANIQEGCGRMQNRLLSFQNGTQACCRYRHNFDQIQGEIFGFYLSQILQIRNLAPSALAIIKSKDPQWSSVRQQLNLAQWAEEKPVVMTQFIDSLSQAYIPPPFRGSNRRLHPIDIAINPPFNSVESNNNIVNSDSSASSKDIQELAQWSDLIVFDYLTANLDRMVNNLYNLQWNPSMMEAPAHNLAKDTRTGLLVFLDNESGLLHGYRLLDKYEQYHRIMLDSLCVFRKSTAEAIKRLHRERNVGDLLKTMFASVEGAKVMTNYLPMIPDKSIKILNHRIDRVYDQISKCESLYMSSSPSPSSKSEV